MSRAIVMLIVIAFYSRPLSMPVNGLYKSTTLELCVKVYDGHVVERWTLIGGPLVQLVCFFHFVVTPER